LLIKIKPHSALVQFFTEEELYVDINSYTDIPRYLDSMQPAFFNYVKEQKSNLIEEGYVLLDKNLKELTYDDLLIRAVREGDVIHIVPAVFGGGGKRGGLLAVAALFAMFVFFPVGAGALGGLGGGAAGATATAAGKTAAAAASGAAGGGLFSNLPPFLSNILVNVGLSMLSALFTKKQDDADSASRQNDMFGSLQNSTSSDTPVALHYGQVRVAGQLVSGYIQTINHARNETVTVDGVIQGLRYDGGGSKGKGSWLFSSSSASDSGIYNDKYGYVDSQYYSQNATYGLIGFSNVNSSVATFDITTANPGFNGYYVDETYLEDVKKPVLESTYIGADRLYMYTLSPASDTVVSYDLGSVNASVAGIISDSTALQGVHDITLDTYYKIAYVVSKDSNTVTSIDITDPYSMFIIDSYTDNTLLADVTSIAHDLYSNTVYVISSSSNTISAIDVSEGSFGQVLCSLQDNTAFASSTNLVLDTQNKRLYVGSTSQGKIHAIDVSDRDNIFLADSFNAGGYSSTAPVKELVLFSVSGRPHIGAIFEASPTIRVYDITDAGVTRFGQYIGTPVAATNAPANCSSLSNRGSILIVSCASSDTILGYKYLYSVERIDEDEGPDTIRTIRTLSNILTVTSDEYLDGVSSAVIMGA
jgi:predicted phage tail protein